MNEQIITPSLIKRLNYYSKCVLAADLNITNPMAVKIVGTVILDSLENVTSVNAALTKE